MNTDLNAIALQYNHVRRLVSWDSCRIHGIGFGPCRICRMERYTPRHRMDVKTCEGYPRMFPH